MKTISISNNRFKISIGILIFIIAITSILATFLLSIGLFLITMFEYVFDLSMLIGPFMVLTLLLSIIIFFTDNQKIKVVAFNAAAFFFALGAVDVAKMIWPSFDLRNSIIGVVKKEEPKKEPVNAFKPTVNGSDITVFYDDQKNYFVSSDVLGYAPAKGRKTRTFATYQSDTLFDVVYSIDKDGLRVSPPYSRRANQSIIFFGCSLTFGYGLEDHETMPYMTGIKTNGQYKIYNLAFNGYGTHQMVSMMEHHYVDSIVKIPPKYIVYTAIADHINRIANKKDWGQHDPKYEVDDTGEAVYAGHFDDLGNHLLTKFMHNFKTNYVKLKSKSYVLQMIGIGNHSAVLYEEKDQELFVALVVKARDLTKKKYPKAEFHMIYWPIGFESEKKVLAELEQHNIKVHLITQIIPDNGNVKKYWIKYPIEPHPNAVGSDVISDYIVREIVNTPVSK